MFLDRFRRDERGNFSIMLAGAAVCILTCVGVAVDYSAMTAAKQSLQQTVDSAALAGAIVADKDSKKNRKETVVQTFAANDFESLNLTQIGAPTIRFNDTQSIVRVSADAKVKTLFIQNFGAKYNTVNASASVSYAVDNVKPIALAFVMDVSGSMDWVVTGDAVKKIDALKDASEELFDAVERGIGRKSTVEQVLRASLSSYNTALVPAWTVDMQGEKSRRNGTSTPTGLTARGHIKTMTAMGGTNSTPALQDALGKLKSEIARDSRTQAFLLFMTDGDNNDPLEDPNSRAICDQAKAEGIKIYSVAFDAPEKGTALLLQCASSLAKTVDESLCDGTKPSKKCKTQKAGYFFDAGNAKKLKRAFKDIGDDIGEQNIVIRS